MPVNIREENGDDARIEEDGAKGGKPDQISLGERKYDHGRGDQPSYDYRDEKTVMQGDAAGRVVEQHLEEKVGQCKIGNDSGACSVDRKEYTGECSANIALPSGVSTTPSGSDGLDIAASNVSCQNNPE